MTSAYEASRLRDRQMLYHIVGHHKAIPYVSLCGREMSADLWPASPHEAWVTYEHYTVCRDLYGNVCQACLDTIDPLVLLDMVAL